MSRTELEDKLADYAFGNMSASERETFAAALANDPELAAEYETAWQPMVAALPLAAEQVELPATMRQRVLNAALQGVPTGVQRPTVGSAAASPITPPVNVSPPAAPPAPRPTSGPPPVRPWCRLVVLFSRPQLALGGMAIMLVISLASLTWAFTTNGQLERDKAEISAEQTQIDGLLADPGSRLTSLQPTEHWQKGSGKAVYDPGKNMVYVTMSGPPPKNNMDCQLWAIKDGQTISLAVFTMKDQTASYMAQAPAQLKSYSGLMISWEKPGGATQPTKDWIMLEGAIQNN